MLYKREMNEIYYIFILFSILFLVEKRAINILISFVGLIISVATMLPTIQTTYGGGETLEKIDGEYYSYILILVQVSALTILFGFIIMLFPNLSHTTSINKLATTYNYPKNKQGSIKGRNYLVLGLLTLLIILLIYFIQPHFVQPMEGSTEWRSSILSIFNIPKEEISYTINQRWGDLDIIKNVHIDTSFLRKIGESLYSFDNSIIKLIILTIILLLAIISLFFIISL